MHSQRRTGANVRAGPRPTNTLGIAMTEQENPAATLEAMIEGIADDLFWALETSSLALKINEKADGIDRANFGAFFGSIHIILNRFYILSVARMFERPNTRYTIRSIFQAISWLRAHVAAIPIKQMPELEKELCRLGANKPEVDTLCDEQLSAFVADFFEGRFRNIIVDGLTAEQLLEDLKTIRDKVVTHPEHIDAEDMRTLYYKEYDAFLQFAREFVSTIGFGYFSIVYRDDSGSYSLDSDATRSTRSLTRLLASLGVADDQELQR